jgi:hypothetical protein
LLINQKVIKLQEGDASTYKPDFTDYLDWLNCLKNKFVVHLAENLNSYPLLKARFSKEKGLDNLIKVLHDSFYIYRQVNHNTEQEIRCVSFGRKVFFAAPREEFRKTADLTFMFPQDKFIYEQHQLVRGSFSIFNQEGQILPLANANVLKKDLVSVKCALSFFLRGDKFGMNFVLVNASVLDKLRQSEHSVSPFGII